MGGERAGRADATRPLVGDRVMENRSVIIVLLFFVAISSTGLLIALMVAVAPRLGLPLSPWIMPAATFIMFVVVFFLARDVVLSPPLITPAWKALTILCGWMAVTLVLWQGVLWALRPLMSEVGFDRGTLLVLLGCMLVSVKVLERLTARLPARRSP
jgi:hypothetical protein